jgi:hypothetical protein
MDAALENHSSEEAKSKQSGKSGRSTVTREEKEQDLTGCSAHAATGPIGDFTLSVRVALDA